MSANEFEIENSLEKWGIRINILILIFFIFSLFFPAYISFQDSSPVGYICCFGFFFPLLHMKATIGINEKNEVDEAPISVLLGMGVILVGILAWINIVFGLSKIFLLCCVGIALLALAHPGHFLHLLIAPIHLLHEVKKTKE